RAGRPDRRARRDRRADHGVTRAAPGDDRMLEMSPVVLVHGAWHGAWCWAALQAELDRRGVPTYAVDLPGHGASLLPLGDLYGDAEHVAAVLAALAGRGPAILVGHSYAGAVVTEAAVRAPVPVGHLVYIGAFALDEGESVFDALKNVA